MYIHKYIYVCIRIYICIYFFIVVYICIYIYIYIYIYVYIYIYIYIYIRDNVKSNPMACAVKNVYLYVPLMNHKTCTNRVLGTLLLLLLCAHAHMNVVVYESDCMLSNAVMFECVCVIFCNISMRVCARNTVIYACV